MAFLSIAGTDFSDIVATLSSTHEPIWSEDTGRTLTAQTVGDIVAYKWKLQIKTRPLKQEEIAELLEALESAPFIPCSFIPTNKKSKAMVKATFYSGSATAEIYTYSNKLEYWYSGVSFSLVEQ
uniref:Uncharacterized protein n=1 Tax=Dulem virus 39 TaxID=3145757 RepID=A0AAU8B7D2_9CAUD